MPSGTNRDTGGLSRSSHKQIRDDIRVEQSADLTAGTVFVTLHADPLVEPDLTVRLWLTGDPFTGGPASGHAVVLLTTLTGEALYTNAAEFCGAVRVDPGVVDTSVTGPAAFRPALDAGTRDTRGDVVTHAARVVVPARGVSARGDGDTFGRAGEHVTRVADSAADVFAVLSLHAAVFPVLSSYDTTLVIRWARQVTTRGGRGARRRAVLHRARLAVAARQIGARETFDAAR